MFKNILVSVSDKTGIVEFIRPYVQAGAKVVSSGGTAKTLRDAGIEVQDVSDYTGFPECMDGRVKTLHPKVHMGLLYRAHLDEDLQLLKQHGAVPFDLVVANLYPFSEAQARGVTGDDLIEYIDIGGPSMLRGAAKNFKYVSIVCDPKDYSWIQKKAELTIEDRKKLAGKVFDHTASYDRVIADQFKKEIEKGHGESLQISASLVQTLRYGENPQQKAWWYKTSDEGMHNAKILQGKEVSYNNILDLQAAVSTVRLFKDPAAVAIKHNNPCGVASDVKPFLALDKALKADPVSVFGGIIAVNFPVGEAEANLLNKIFLECVIAPEIKSEALAIFAQKKNLRVLSWPALSQFQTEKSVRSIDGGYLVQEEDQVDTDRSQWQFLGDKPSAELEKDILFAWKTCAMLKSNAISVCGQSQSLGLGMGQVNRVDSVRQALDRAKEFHPQAKDLILASDAFFPFPDSVEIAAQYGIKWIVQPGGSVKDAEVIEAAKKHSINMVLTGRRHFRH